jgi:hypothetical protein
MDQPTNVYEDVLILQLMREQISATPGGQSVWAKSRGFSRAFISDVLNKKRGVSGRLARALGFHKMTFFAPLDAFEEPTPTSVEPEPEGPVTSEFLAAFSDSEV